MARTDRRHVALGGIVLIILAIVLPPFINVNRYRARIADVTSNALGRPVSIGAISLNLLPQPGFTLENFVVGDDPAFSSEPILRADEVRATLRMTSLWRGKLEIAKLSLQYPSLNLVRSADGKLNLESLLAHASRTSAAPTTARKPEGRARFPYIQADTGRINFKSGLDKKAFALIDTDFSLWSENENEWRMRLVGKPLRTDTNVSDTGTLRIEGSFRRADNLRDTPLQVKFSLERGQLGQITKVIYGRDRGWRGAAEMSGTASGTPANLQVLADGSVQDFRRYDISKGEAIRLQVHCSAIFSSSRESLNDMQCEAPADTGSLRVAGNIEGFHGEKLDLTVAVKTVPVNWVVAIARHAKRDLPGDLAAVGTLSGEFHATKSPDAITRWEGQGSTEKLGLKSELLGKDLLIGTVNFGFDGPPQVKAARNIKTAPAAETSLARVEFRPFAVALGGASPASASGWIAPDGYSLSLQGDADLERLMQVGRALGIGVPHFRALGPTRMAVNVGGTWVGFAQPNAMGTLQLHGVSAEIPGIAQPVQLSAASVTLAATEMRMQNVVASVGGVNVSGNAVFPRSCADDAPCTSRWNVRFDEVDPARLNVLLNPRLKQRPWYRFFGGGNREESVLAKMDATGQIYAKRFLLRSMAATGVTADFSLRKAKLDVNLLHAEVLGGTHTGIWSADFSGKEPEYSGSGTVSKINVAQLAALTKETWGSGALTGDYKLSMSGWTLADFTKSATGEAHMEIRDGLLRHVALDNRGLPTRFLQMSLQVKLDGGEFQIAASKLQTPNGIYQVSGTATLDRNLQLQMSTAGGAAYKVTGTLEKPQVVAVPAREAEASLKK
jgi:hypothetical protein